VASSVGAVSIKRYPSSGRSSPIKHRLAPSKHNRREREVQLVDQARPQVLADRGHAAANFDVQVTSGVACALERRVKPVRHEVEGGASLHHDRIAGVMR
jgi:hypothetical protein